MCCCFKKKRFIVVTITCIQARPQDKGKALVPGLVDDFKQRCAEKIRDPNQHFGQTEFDRGELHCNPFRILYCTVYDYVGLPS